jgi:putative oxidoreductase
MKTAALIARILLGVVFLVMGLNGFLNFIPGPLPAGPAGDFLSLLAQTHYVLFVSALQIAGGVLVLVNRYVPLGLVLLGPVIVNIFLFHLLMALRYRQYFSSIFVHRAS